jgi:agmatine/peptidylarginine deiminase
MIPDWQTDLVYFSDLLAARHPDLWSRLVAILDAAGVPHRLIEGTRDIWVRDFMPVQVATDDFVLFSYRPDYLRGHEHLITPDEARCLVPPGGRLRRSAINLDGGHVVTDGDTAILTDKVYRENPGHERPMLRAELADLLRAEVVVVLKEPYDVIGHADGVVRFVGDGVVVVNDYREVDPCYGGRLEAALRRHGLAVERLPHFRTDEKHDGIWSAAGNYANFLRVGRLVVVPAYGVPEDDLACRTLERLLPGPVSCRCGARGWPARVEDRQVVVSLTLTARPRGDP